jgi:hypothetical protein
MQIFRILLDFSLLFIGMDVHCTCGIVKAAAERLRGQGDYRPESPYMKTLND